MPDFRKTNQCKWERGDVFLSTTSGVDVRVYSTVYCISFRRMQCGCQHCRRARCIPSIVCSVDLQSVSINTASSVDVQGASLFPRLLYRRAGCIHPHHHHNHTCRVYLCHIRQQRRRAGCIPLHRHQCRLAECIFLLIFNAFKCRTAGLYGVRSVPYWSE